MATERKIAANRANALKSTGPVTPEGKAVVSQNAVSHGILSRETIIGGEDEKLFRAFSKSLRRHLAPANELEALLTDRIIANTWRLRRLLSAEGEIFWGRGGVAEGDMIDVCYALAFIQYDSSSRSDIFIKMSRYESTLERGMFRALHELQRLQAARAGQNVPPPAALDLHVHGGGEL